MTNTMKSVVLQIPDEQTTNSDVSPNADIAPSKMAQRVMAEQHVPFSRMRVWDNWGSLPVTTAANDDLAIITGTFGTDSLQLSAGDLKAAGATSRKIGFEMEVPANYDDGETFEIRIRAGMETTVADTSATVDLEVYLPDGDGAVGSDLCTTAAQDINSLTIADKDFTIDASSLDPSDRLQCVVTVAVNDSATGTAVTAVVNSISRRCDTRG